MHDAATCCDNQIGTHLWLTAYRAWFDHDRAGNSRRATAWGWIADRIVRWA